MLPGQVWSLGSIPEGSNFLDETYRMGELRQRRGQISLGGGKCEALWEIKKKFQCHKSTVIKGGDL